MLKRFRDGGLEAVPRRFAPGSAADHDARVDGRTAARDRARSHTVGVDSANWTTGLLASYLAEQTGMAVYDETVRIALHAHDYVCKRPTWTLKRKAEEQDGYVGKA